VGKTGGYQIVVVFTVV